MPSSPPARFTAQSAALDRVDWAAFSKTLFDFAFGRCKSREMARDLAQEAMRRLLEATASWDPVAEPDPTRYAMGVVNSLLANERTSAAATRTVPLDASAPNEPRDESLEPPDAQAMTEDKMVAVDLFDRRLALTRHYLAGDPEALAMLDLTIAGYDTPAEICARTNRLYEPVIAARKRMQRAAESATRALPEGDDASEAPDADDRDDDESEVA